MKVARLDLDSHLDDALLENAAFLQYECGWHIELVCDHLGVSRDTLEQKRRRKERVDAVPDSHEGPRAGDEPADGSVPAVRGEPRTEGRGVGSPPDTLSA